MSHPIPQSEPALSRRQFLGATGALAFGAAYAPSLLATAAPDDRTTTTPSTSRADATVQIGVLLGAFGQSTLEAKLDAVKSHGLDCVQFSFDCAGLPAMPDEIPPGLADQIRRQAAARSIAIAAVQGTFNMSHPDPEQRRVGLRQLRVLAEACPHLGTSKIHICTGTRDRQSMWRRHADNDSVQAWNDMVACVREATAMAQRAGVVLGFEPEVNNVVDSAQKARRLLDEIDSPHLKVTIDPANIFHAGELPRMKEMLDQAFALLGKDIVMAHAKDLDHDGDAGHKAAGQGKLDYDRYLSSLRAAGFNGPILLHGLSEAQVPGCVAFLREKLARLAPDPSQSK